MNERPPDRLWSGIDIVKLIAGTLAAVSAAVIGSFLGVAGTLTGAAVASLIGGLGTELYAKSLRHGVSKLRDSQVQLPVAAPAAVGTPPVASAAVEEEKPGHFDPVPQTGAKRRPRWRLIAIPAVAFFVLAMGAVTVVEGIAGESFAAMFGHESAGSTTLSSAGRKISGNSRRADPAPENSGAPGQRGTDPTATTRPSPGATTTAPSSAATTTPTQTGAPTPAGGTGDTGTTPGDTGGQNEQGGTGTQGGTGDQGGTQPNADTRGGTGGEQGLSDQQAPESP